ncbi:MAG: tetratricopeptide repeat protein [Bacillota bacterium]
MFRKWFLIAALLMLVCSTAQAETKYITASGEYTMGEGETIINAKDMALRQAMRSATEQVGVYVESYSKVSNSQLTQDEINVMSSSVMEIVKKEYADPQAVGGGFRYVCTITAKVTTDSIDMLRNSRQLKADQGAERYAQEQKQMAELMAQLALLKTELPKVKTEEQKQVYVTQVTQLSQKINAVARAQTNLSAKQWYDTAVEYSSKDNALAINILNKAIVIDNEYYAAYIMRGDLYATEGNNKKAAADYTAAIKLEPRDVKTIDKLFAIHTADGNLQGLILDYDRLIGIDGTNADYYAKRAALYGATGNNKQAISDYTTALQYTSAKKNIYIARAEIYEKLKDSEAAKQDYYNAYAPELTARINANPNDYEAFLQRADVLYRNNRLDLALANVNWFLKTDAENEQAQLLRARIFLAKQDYEQTITVCNGIINTSPLQKSAYDIRAKANARLGNAALVAQDKKSSDALSNIATLTGHSSWIYAVAFSPDGQNVASGSADTTVKLWNVAKRKCVATLSGHGAAVNSVTFDPSGKYLASSADDSMIKLWDVASLQCVATLAGHGAHVLAVTFSPDGKYLASGSEDNTVKLWDMTSKQCVATYAEHTGAVNSLSFSPDSRYLASSGSSDKSIKLWDIALSQCVGTLTGNADKIEVVLFSPDGKYLACGSDDETVKLWDVAGRQCIATLTGNAEKILSLAFSPDGKFIASGGDTNTIRLWDFSSRLSIAALSGHTSGISAVAFSADGQYLASGGSYDKSIKLWDIAGIY